MTDLEKVELALRKAFIDAGPLREPEVVLNSFLNVLIELNTNPQEEVEANDLRHLRK